MNANGKIFDRVKPQEQFIHAGILNNFAQISDLLNAQLKTGVITNNFLRGDDYTREIANGLYIHEADGALLLFRERGDHLVMTFHRHPNAVLVLQKKCQKDK